MSYAPIKKLIEVALPLDAVNDASAYDKMPGIGPHPKGIHHWWARLPLPAARAVLFASLVNDPATDPEFQGKSRKEQEAERQRLFSILRDLLQKQPHTKPDTFAAAHREIVRSCNGDLPTLLDPFCGGGSIPLEGQRLGLRAVGTDLNPLPVLITRAQIAVLPRFAGKGPVHPKAESRGSSQSSAWGMAEDIRSYARDVLKALKKTVGRNYPVARAAHSADANGSAPIAWIWARTVVCPNPACGAEMPLISNLALATKKTRRTWLHPIVERTPAGRRMRFEVRTGSGSIPAASKIGRGAKFRCMICGQDAAEKYIRQEGKRGAFGTQLLATVVEGPRGRMYVAATEEQETAALSVEQVEGPAQAMCDHTRWFSPPIFGYDTFDKVFSRRQLASLMALSDAVKAVQEDVEMDAVRAGMSTDARSLSDGGAGARAYAQAVVTFLAFAIDRCTDFNSTLCRWSPSNEKVMNLFGRQAIPMLWDYAEANLLAESVGGWLTCANYVAQCVQVIPVNGTRAGEAYQANAAAAAKTDFGHLLVSTDPPYYDNIGYSDLSDYFYVWIRRTLQDVYPDLLSTMLVPKAEELVASAYRFDGDAVQAKSHFEMGFRQTFDSLRLAMDLRFPMTVYYAFKQEEDGAADEADEGGGVDLTTGWETLLEALLSAGFQVTGTWPVRASQAWRMVSMGTNALASYIVLSCRPRETSAPSVSRRDLIAHMKRELPDALRGLQQSSIAPVDLAQAAIGPGMAVFSRYGRVLENDGRPMSVRAALALINQVLDEVLAEQEGEFDSDTRWALAWFDQYGFSEDAYGQAEVLATAKNTSVAGLAQAGIVASSRGKVRLLKRNELDPDWEPSSDARRTVWEATHHLMLSLEKSGERSAARLLAHLRSDGEVARDLAYRLYTTCERKGWVQEAQAYNALVVAWPEIARQAAEVSDSTGAQGSLSL